MEIKEIDLESFEINESFDKYYYPVTLELEEYHGWDTHYNALFYAQIYRSAKQVLKKISFSNSFSIGGKYRFNNDFLQLLELEPDKVKSRKVDPKELYAVEVSNTLLEELKKFDKRASTFFNIFTQKIFDVESEKGFECQMLPEKIISFLEELFSGPKYLEVYQWNIDWIPSDFKIGGYKERFDFIDDYYFAIWTVYDKKTKKLTVLFGDFYYEFW